MNRESLNKLIDEIDTVIRPQGFRCIETQWLASGMPVLRLYIDHVDTNNKEGVTVDECAEVSRLLSDFLDSKIEQQYNLEVSSPGVERPLRKMEHFIDQLNNGKKIKVKLLSPSFNRSNGTGELIDINQKENMVTLSTDNGPWSFSLDKLKQASLVYDWNIKTPH